MAKNIEGYRYICGECWGGTDVPERLRLPSEDRFFSNDECCAHCGNVELFGPTDRDMLLGYAQYCEAMATYWESTKTPQKAAGWRTEAHRVRVYTEQECAE